MVKVVLMDIEGTTTSITFVHDVLFPYARKHIRNFVAKHRDQKNVQQILKDAAALIIKEADENYSLEDWEKIVAHMESWIDQDKKHGPLKSLQGLIWEEGYRQKEYTSHLYDDVLPKLKEWREKGLTLVIYSSGSVQAQKLLFAHTPFGDVTPLLSAYFDTAVGHKRERASYTRIAAEVGRAPSEILFLSDIAEELDAAQDAGMKTTQLLRPGTVASGRHATAVTFNDIIF